jgi:hypothetical protein
MALVDEKAAGTWSVAPERFPVRAIAGSPSVSVEVFECQETGSNFLILEFWADQVARLRIRAWPFGVTSAGRSR